MKYSYGKMILSEHPIPTMVLSRIILTLSRTAYLVRHKISKLIDCVKSVARKNIR